jgi:hypothetical protein
MNNPSNNLTKLARSKRSLSRLGLLVLAVLMTLGAAQSPAGATVPTVEAVLPPTPRRRRGQVPSSANRGAAFSGRGAAGQFRHSNQGGICDPYVWERCVQ